MKDPFNDVLRILEEETLQGVSLKRTKILKLFPCVSIFLIPSCVCVHSSHLPQSWSLSISVLLSALSVAEACDWTAAMLISIMLRHPSSTCMKLRKT